MSETNFGITEYVGNHNGFLGIVKERYSDFHVNEVSENGTVQFLDDKKVISVPDNSDMEEEGKFIIPKCLSGSSIKELESLSTDSGDDCKSVYIDVENFSKDDRKYVHFFIRKKFPNLESETGQNEGKKCIIATKVSSKSGQKRNRQTGDYKFTHFLMYKENIDTMEAMNVLAGKLRLKPGAFAYAGTKDKRAKTTQAVSARGIRPENIANAANGIHAITVGNFSFSKESLRLGMLGGNHFRIALRNVDTSDEILNTAFDALETKGFINYFGMQRFGSGQAQTHLIGKALIQQQWKKAVDLILTAVPSDPPEMVAIKTKWLESNDAKLCNEMVRSKSRYKLESKLISGLAKRDDNDYVGSLNQIPRNTRLLYVHAYQSYVWNKVVSKRIKKFGLEVLEGDLIEKQSQGTAVPIVENSEEFDRMDVIALSDSQVSSVAITQIYMPMPGYAMKYPENIIKTWYEEILAEDGLTLKSFRNRVKDYALRGSYRRIIVKPKNCSRKICHYDDPSLPLIASDVEKLHGTNIQLNCLKSGKYKAFIIEMTLPPSCYATMALRELTRLESSSAIYKGTVMKRLKDLTFNPHMEIFKEEVVKSEEELEIDSASNVPMEDPLAIENGFGISEDKPLVSDAQSINPQRPQATSNNKKKKKQTPPSTIDQLVRVVGEQIENTQAEDQYVYFGKNLAAKLRNISSTQRIYAEKLINDVIFAAEFGHLSSASIFTPNHFNITPIKNEPST